jgi:hypothetical protein
MTFTRQQQHALKVLRLGWVTPGELARHLNGSPEGAAATASSLVRRGVADRIVYRGHVHYRAKPDAVGVR